MNSIDPTKVLLSGFALSGIQFTLGYLGGKSLQLIMPSVSPMGYATVLGLWPAAAAAMIVTAEKINGGGSKATIFNVIIGFVGGYIASLVFTNLLGMSVSLVAPFMGLAAMACLASCVALVALPILGFVGLSTAVTALVFKLFFKGA